MEEQVRPGPTARVPAQPAWWRGYRTGWWRADLVAGVTITAYLVPQVMAYAELAGLPAETGLWAALGALGLYAVVGSSRVLSVGPESTTALLTASAIGSVAAGRHDPVAFASVLALTVATVCLVAWVARLSVLADLLSRPVLVGYLAGVAVIMIVSQLGRLSGIAVPEEPVWRRVLYVVQHLADAEPATAALGLATLAAMLLGTAVRRHAPVALLGMLAATATSSLLALPEHGVRLVGDIPAGLPAPALPPFDASLFAAAVVPALGIAFVGYTDNVLTARAFATQDDQRVDARRELLGLAFANAGAALMRGFPVSSSGSRTAIGDAVGARSQATGLFTLACTALAVLTLRPLLEAFPSTALGAVVVYAAVRLIRVDEFRRLARVRRSELVIALATAAAVVGIGVLPAVLVAIGLSFLDLLRRVARPHDAVLGYVEGLAGMHDVEDHPDASVVSGLVVYRYDSPLFFANADDFRTRVLAAVAANAPVRWLVLNAEAISDVDSTALDALESVRHELADRGVVVALARVEHAVRLLLERSGFVDRIGAERIYPTLPTAVDAYREAVGQRPGGDATGPGDLGPA